MLIQAVHTSSMIRVADKATDLCWLKVLCHQPEIRFLECSAGTFESRYHSHQPDQVGSSDDPSWLSAGWDVPLVEEFRSYCLPAN